MLRLIKMATGRPYLYDFFAAGLLPLSFMNITEMTLKSTHMSKGRPSIVYGQSAHLLSLLSDAAYRSKLLYEAQFFLQVDPFHATLHEHGNDGRILPHFIFQAILCA